MNKKERKSSWNNKFFQEQYYEKSSVDAVTLSVFRTLGIQPSRNVDVLQQKETFVHPYLNEAILNMKDQESATVILGNRDLCSVVSCAIMKIFSHEVFHKHVLVLLDQDTSEQRTEKMLHQAEEILGRSLRKTDHIFLHGRDVVISSSPQKRPFLYEQFTYISDPVEYIKKQDMFWEDDGIKELLRRVSLIKDETSEVGQRYQILENTLTTRMLFDGIMTILVCGSGASVDSTAYVVDLLELFVDYCVSIYEEE